MRSDESNPSHQRLTLTASHDAAGSFYHAGCLTYRGQLTDVLSDFSILSLAAGATTSVTEEHHAGGTRLVVTNGRLRFVVSPQYASAVTELALDEIEQLALADSYPVPGSFSWTSPWYGGIHPAIRRWRPGQPSFHSMPEPCTIPRAPRRS